MEITRQSNANMRIISPPRESSNDEKPTSKFNDSAGLSLLVLINYGAQFPNIQRRPRLENPACFASTSCDQEQDFHSLHTSLQAFSSFDINESSITRLEKGQVPSIYQRSASIAIKKRRDHSGEGDVAEGKLLQESVRMYNNATWQMYNRIMQYRAKQSLSKISCTTPGIVRPSALTPVVAAARLCQTDDIDFDMYDDDIFLLDD